MSEPARKIEAYIPISEEVLTGAVSLQAAIVEALTNPQPPKPAPPPPPPPIPAGHRALLEALTLDRVLRAVVDHHEPNWRHGDWVCEGCDADGYEWEPPRWPCSTVELIAQQIDVHLGDGSG